MPRPKTTPARQMWRDAVPLGCGHNRPATHGKPTGADLVDPTDPAYRHIINAALTLMKFGFRPGDPDIAERAIRVGRDDYLRDQAARKKADITDDDRALRAAIAAQAGEVVYYMRIGNRVKIGWSTNLPQRLATINPEELLAVEPGGRGLETDRHREFAELRVHGEWFRMEEPLVSHIATLTVS